MAWKTVILSHLKKNIAEAADIISFRAKCCRKHAENGIRDFEAIISIFSIKDIWERFKEEELRVCQAKIWT